MIYILLMTGSWWGNTTVNTKSTLTSSIPEIMATGMLTNQTRLNVISEATRVLQLLLTLGIAETVTVSGEIPNRGTLYLSVKVDEPNRELTTNFIYALNWDEQKITIERNLW
jgi:phage gp46-like protein